MLKKYHTIKAAGWRAGACNSGAFCPLKGALARRVWNNGYYEGLRHRIGQPYRTDNAIVQDIMRFYGLTPAAWFKIRLLVRWELIDSHRELTF